MNSSPPNHASFVGGLNHYLVAAAMLLLIAVCAAQYYELDFNFLMGDDVYNVSDVRAGTIFSSPQSVLFGIYADKWRPVFHSVFALEATFFGYSYKAYVIFNLMVHSISSIILYLVLLELSRGRQIVAVVGAVVFATSRFADYQIWQATGSVEGLGTLFLIAAAWFYVDLARAKSLSKFWRVIAMWCLACLAHERHLVFLPTVVLAAFSVPSERPLRWGVIWGVSALAVVALNVGYKTIMGGKVLVGTGGTELDFDVVRFAVFFGSALANAFGFNFGDTYLSGQSMFEAPRSIWALSILLCLLFLACFVFAIVGNIRNTSSGSNASTFVYRWAKVLLIPSALAASALVASVTFRQEFRWVFTVQLVAVVGMAVGLGSVKKSTVANVVGGLILIGSLYQSHYYRQKEPNVYFFSSQADVENIDRLLAGDNTTEVLYVVVNDMQGQCTWSYGAGRWFNVYGPNQIEKVVCARGVDGLPLEAGQPGSRVLLASSNPQLASDITADVKERMMFDVSGRKHSSLIDGYQSSWLNSQAPQSTPSGLGAFVSDAWGTAAGPQRALIVLTGFNVAAPVPADASGTELRFQAGMNYPSEYPAVLWVSARAADGTEKRLWSQEMRGPEPGSAAKTKTIRLAMPDERPHALVFGVDTPAGDPSSHWAIFGNPMLVWPEGGVSADLPANSSTLSEQCSILSHPPSMGRITWCMASPT